MQERHTNRTRYFKEQKITTEKYVIPFIKEVVNINQDTTVLEVGCGEGGNLLPFMLLGCKKIVGVDISKGKIDNAREYFSKFKNNNYIELINDDIYNINDIGLFDIIIIRDVLEHIHNQNRFMHFIKNFIKSNSRIFIGFPPWYNPFGGHQQICESKILSKTPFFHILPKFIYVFILKVFGESNTKVNNLIEIKQTGISIERFEKILKKENYKKDKRIFYFISPNYKTKFNLTPRKAGILISSIPFVRNFFITTNFYLISMDNHLNSEF